MSLVDAVTNLVSCGIIILLIGSVFVLIPCLWYLYHHWNEQWFAKRGVFLLVIFIGISGFHTILVNPLLLLCETNRISLNKQIQHILSFCWFNLCTAAASVVAIRILLQFVNIKRNQESKTEYWKYQLNPEYKQSLIIKYYYIFGNPYYVTLFIFFIWFCEVSMGLIVMLTNNGSFSHDYKQRYFVFFEILVSIWIIKIIAVGYCVYKIRKDSQDYWFIWSEFKIIFWSMIITTIVCIIGYLIQMIILSYQFTFTQQVTRCAVCFWSVYMWYIMTFWVHCQNIKQIATINQKKIENGVNGPMNIISNLLQTEQGNTVSCHL